jgi:MFS family permease
VSGGIIVSGLVSIHYHWRTIYWVSAALIGTCTVLVILTFPETMYRRDDASPPGFAESATMNIDSKGTVDQIQDVDIEEGTTAATSHEKRSYIASLRIYSGTYTKEPLWKLFIRPAILLTLPSVLWATLVMSGTIGFLVAISSNFAPAFAQAYGFQPWQSGLCFIAALIGAFVGIFCGGHLSDWIADIQTRRNNGIREPEMRLPAIGISVVTAPLALFLYGIGINNRLHWMCPTVGLALIKSHEHPISLNF